MANKKEFKIFNTARLKFEEMKEDVMNYIKMIYSDTGETFTSASPFAQIVIVILHLGRMILYYISSALNELNINKAYHDRSIKGLSTLTGHNPSRGCGAKGSVKLVYKMNTDYINQTVIIPNNTVIKNLNNGLSYILTMPSENLQVIVGSSSSNVTIPIVQGTLKYQQATGTGLPLQSFNFANKNLNIIDDYYVNVYVNGERWLIVKSILDMTYNEKACIVKTGESGGLDLFFGTGLQGAVPDSGSTILIEYLVSNGNKGNISMLEETGGKNWEFEGAGTNNLGETVSLNDIFSITTETDILFGSNPENIQMTRLLTPHISRSFVLANNKNFEYFLRNLNIFSIIDTISGFNSYEDNIAQINYNTALNNYNLAQSNYLTQINLTGQNSSEALTKYELFKNTEVLLDKAELQLNESKLDDNIIYLFLIPDISKRIPTTANYFTCDTNVFTLTDNEKTRILELIENSGQKIMTIDNQIIDPKMPQFAINIFIQIWENYDFNNIKDNVITAISDYLISNTRRDRIPVSDLIKIVENIDGVDSVNIFFDADKNNSIYYGDNKYGIDEYGDIILNRSLTDSLGNTINVNDLFPLFRAKNTFFTSPAGIEYYDDLTNLSSVINITLRGKTTKTITKINNIN